VAVVAAVVEVVAEVAEVASEDTARPGLRVFFVQIVGA
jgi:hypothetical protein